MRIAAIGATGTVGAHVTSRLNKAGIDVVEITRSNGVDLLDGNGLREAVTGVDVAIDTANPLPDDDSITVPDAFATATRNVSEVCRSAGVRLVFLSIVGVENPAFDEFPYYAAKRAQERVVRESGVAATIVKSTQFAEFATSPMVAGVRDGEVSVQDWLFQPIAADSVADALIRTATDTRRPPVTVIGGVQPIRLPDFVGALLRSRHDDRRLRTVPAQLPAFGDGSLLPPVGAELLGPRIDEWLGSGSAEHTWRQLDAGHGGS